MSKFVLDTGILLHLAKATPLAKDIIIQEGIFNEGSTLMICVVSLGEILALTQKAKIPWGAKQIEAMVKVIETLVVIDIRKSAKPLIDAYVEIDCWSQNQLPQKKRGLSTTMGKNDLWIAATAHYLKAALVTTDKDFDHLEGEYIDLRRY